MEGEPTKGGKCVCIVGARKGSRRLPGKNRLALGERPLFKIALEAARKASIFEKILFSTDDEEISIQLNRENDEDVLVDRRPASLADDRASMIDVGVYLLEKYRSILGTPHVLCFLSPCHPFRTARDIVSAYRLFTSRDALSLISVTRFPFPPELAVQVEHHRVQRNWEGLVRTGDYGRSYYPNGAVSFVKYPYFMTRKSLFSEDTAAYEMEWPHGLDIDYEEDYLLAQRIFPLFEKERD